MYGSLIRLTTDLVSARLQALTTLRVQLQVHRVETVLLTRVALGLQSEFALEDCWKAVLEMHNYAYVDYANPEWQYAPYSELLREALYVWDRLQNPLDRVEDDPVRPFSPDDDLEDKEVPWRKYNLALMQEAARLTSACFSDLYSNAQEFLSNLEYDARFAITQHLRDIWFGDPYTLGVALLDTTMGSSPFGEHKEQSLFARHLACIVIDAASACVDADASEQARNEGAERLSLLWPILKGYAMSITEYRNSPVGIMAENGVIDLVEQALVESVAAMVAEPDRAPRPRYCYSSPDGTRCAETPTVEIVTNLRARATEELEFRKALRQIR